MHNKDNDDILKKIRNAIIGRKEAIDNGNSKLANKNYNIIVGSVSLLYQNKSIDKLLELIEDNILDVRISVATYLLPFHEDIALRILEKADTFDSKMTIKEWKNGNLTLNHVYKDDK